MKRVFVLILAIMLAVSGISAFALENATRQRAIMLEGIEETITETFYASPNGFTMWYPEDMFRIASEYNHEVFLPADETIENVSLMIVPVEIPVEESDAFIYEATGGYMEGEAEISDVREGNLESGIGVKTVQAVTNTEVHRYYLLAGKEKVFCLTAIFPIEAMEGFGARFEQLIATFDVAAEETEAAAE